MANSNRGPRREVRTYLGDRSRTTGRAVLDCGHERAVPRGASWYYCGACRGAPDDVAAAPSVQREVVELPVQGGDPIQLVRVVAVERVLRRKKRYRFTLSDGTSVTTAQHTIAKGELVRRVTDVDGATCRLNHYGDAFARAWLDMPNPPRANVAQMILETAGFTDMPSEALHTWLSRAARLFFNSVDAESVADAVIAGGPGAAGTVGDVLRSAIVRQNGGTEYGYHRGWYEPIVGAIARWLRTQNLIEPDLSDPDALAVPLVDVWRWDQSQRKKANGRAARLRSAIAERFGFKCAKVLKDGLNSQTVWVRADFEVEKHLLHDVKGFKKLGKSVIVTDDLAVYVCGQHRCVVEAKSADLPHDDQVARRMLAVATTHREEISTLKGDLALLEELFTPYRDAKVWDLACAEEEDA